MSRFLQAINVFKISCIRQFAADALLEKQTNEQVLAAHELQVGPQAALRVAVCAVLLTLRQASNALSGLQDKLVQV
jgi:hypothetical protein